MNRFATWLLDFMRGRYGLDELGRHLGVVWIVLVIVSIVLGVFSSLAYDLARLTVLTGLFGLLSTFVNWASVALLIWMFYRILSRKVDKRRAENERYLARRARRRRRGGDREHASSRGWGKGSGAPGGPAAGSSASGSRQDILHGDPGFEYLTCPFCGQRMRVPQGKGKIAVKCPSCGEKTIHNS